MQLSDTINKFIIDHHIIGTHQDPITLKSGRQSHYYVNWRQATIDAWLLDQLSNHLVAFIQENNISFDSLYGVPEGATKLAVISGLKIAQSQPNWGLGSATIPMGRAKPKQHGHPDDRDFIGKPQGRTLVLEDTLTTGLSLIESIKQLHSHQVDIVGAVVLTDRCERRDDGQTVAQALHKEIGRELPIWRMSQSVDLLPLLAQQLQLSPDECAKLDREFAQYGHQPLNWQEKN